MPGEWSCLKSTSGRHQETIRIARRGYPTARPAALFPPCHSTQSGVASAVRCSAAPRDLQDRRLFHRLSLVPFLAWVGLGADGLSSSAYGPEEAFKALGEHRYPGRGARRAHGDDGAAHLGGVPAHHRGVPQRRRRLRGRDASCSAPAPAWCRAPRCWSTTSSPSPSRSPRPATRCSASCPPSGTAPSCRSRSALIAGAHDPEHPRAYGSR